MVAPLTGTGTVTNVVAPLTGTVTSVVAPLTGTVTSVVAPLTGTVTGVVAPLTGTVFTAAGAPAPVSGAGVLGVAGSLQAAGATADRAAVSVPGSGAGGSWLPSVVGRAGWRRCAVAVGVGAFWAAGCAG